MKIYVELCFGDKLYFRLTLPSGKRETVIGDKWTRRVATEALDLLENVYGIRRRRVRFIHR